MDKRYRKGSHTVKGLGSAFMGTGVFLPDSRSIE